MAIPEAHCPLVWDCGHDLPQLCVQCWVNRDPLFSDNLFLQRTLGLTFQKRFGRDLLCLVIVQWHFVCS